MCFGPRAFVGLAVAALTLASAPAAAGQGLTALQMYTLQGSAEAIGEATAGVELAGVRRKAAGHPGRGRADARQRAKLPASGVKVRLKRNKKGQTVQRAGRAQASAATTCGAPGTSPAGSATSCTRSRAGTRSSSSSRCSARTHQGREMIAMKVTQGARDVPRRITAGGAVLVDCSTRASGSASRSTGACCTTSSPAGGRTTSEIRGILKTHRAVVRLSANPDGYQYTFDHERLWRKNLRDNNGDGQIPSATASIPTATSPSTGATTTRARRPTRPTRRTAGPSAASEPETQAMQGLIDRDQAEVPVEPALVRAVAAVPAGLAGGHARRGQPDLRRARRHRRRSGDRRLQPGAVGRHALRDQRRDDGLRGDERAGRSPTRPSSARARRAPGSSSRTTRR